MRGARLLVLSLATSPAMAQHEHHAPPAAATPTPPTPAPPAVPVVTTPPPIPEPAADALYGTAAMERARRTLREEHGGMRFSQVLFDLAEVQPRHGRDFYRYDAQAWFGGDFDRLVLKSEGAGAFGATPETIEVQALWGHAIGPYFDLQAGVRHDMRRGSDRTYAVVGIEGLAPYWFEVEAHAFLSDRGELFARVKAEHDMRITQRLILQPRVEADAAFQRTPALGIGRGLSDVELGLRLRYELAREVAPYVGVSYERKLGGTARIARAAGEEAGVGGLVLGIRAWF